MQRNQQSIWANTLSDNFDDSNNDWDAIKAQDYERPAEKHNPIYTERRAQHDDRDLGEITEWPDELIQAYEQAQKPKPKKRKEPLPGIKSYLNAGLGIAFGLASIFGFVPEGIALSNEIAVGVVWVGVQTIFMRMGMNKPPAVLGFALKTFLSMKR